MKALKEAMMEQMLESSNLGVAWKSVKAKHGAAGMDGIGVEAFIEPMEPHWATVRAKVADGHYKPAVAKRAYIPKGNGGERPLGIPAVLDRVPQQAMLQVLQPHS